MLSLVAHAPPSKKGHVDFEVVLTSSLLCVMVRVVMKVIRKWPSSLAREQVSS
jgi:hypothetical protein